MITVLYDELGSNSNLCGLSRQRRPVCVTILAGRHNSRSALGRNSGIRPIFEGSYWLHPSWSIQR